MWRLVGGPWCEDTECGGWLVGHGVRPQSVEAGWSAMV